MISIIIPTLNEEKVLRRTLENLRRIDVVNYEIIVSDGGSKDKTVEIAESLADKVIGNNSERRQTIAEGRNAGAAAATGEIFLFLDADVIIPEINEFISQTIRAFAINSKLVGLTVFLKVLPEHVTISDKLFFGIVNRVNQFSNNVLHIGAAAGECQMVRASSFKQLGGFNPKLAVGEDQDLFARLSKIGKTWVETGLHVFHTSRRAHEIGWLKLHFLWWINLLYIKIFKRSFSKEWEVIR